MLTMERVVKKQKDFAKVKRLYETSFPPEERFPLKEVLYGGFCGLDFMAFYEEERFCGFFMLMTQGDLTNILYLAVEEELRSCGYGAQALKLIREMKPNNRIALDIETPDPKAPNQEQRIRRKNFYLRNGYQQSEIAYWWRGVPYEILVSGGKVTEEEFWNFWKGIRTDGNKRRDAEKRSV